MPNPLKAEDLNSRKFAHRIAPQHVAPYTQLFLFLAANALELRTENGCRLNDVTDMRQWFREVAGALAERERQVGA